jgi:hypothetical protein
MLDRTLRDQTDSLGAALLDWDDRLQKHDNDAVARPVACRLGRALDPV